MNTHRILSTEYLLKMRSIGRISKKNADLLDRRLELEVELNRADNYRKFFKKQCVVYDCHNLLPSIGKTDWEHYKTNGNYCQSCHARINQHGSRSLTDIAKRNLLKIFGSFNLK